MLLSYKTLHLEAQLCLQEEGCVVDISRTAGCPTLSTKGGTTTTRLQFSPFLQRRSARAVKTRRLSDYMAHLTLSQYFLDTVRHLQ